jgi:hypothetical protein
MAFSFLYLAVRALLGALVRSRRGLHAKDVELLVLRHELEILRRPTPATTTATGHTGRFSVLPPDENAPSASALNDPALQVRRRDLLAASFTSTSEPPDAGEPYARVFEPRAFGSPPGQHA